MPKRTTKPTTTTSTEPLVCNLCGPNAYPGKHCPNCLAYQKAHYYRGYGVDSPGSADFFCVADSPHSIIISRQTDEHVGWCFDIEKSVRQMFDELRKIKRYAPYYGRYTYATRCTNDWLTKPSGKVIQCCSPLFMEEIVRLAKPDKPILIFAMGGEVLKSFKIKVQKYGSVQGKLLETEVMGRKVLIYPTLSKRQLATKTGYYDVLRAHMNNFLDIVWQLNEGLSVDPHVTIEELTKDYRFPSTLKEVDALVDEILAYALPGKDPKTHAISLDTETNTLFAHRAQLKILSLTVAWDKGKAASIPIEHPDTPWTLEEVRPALKRLFLSSKPKIFHNGKFDLKILARKGFIVENVRWDTMCAEHLLFEDKKKFYGLKEIVAAYFPKYAGYEDKIHDILHHTERQLDEMEKKQAKEETTKKPKESRAKKKLRRDKGYSDIALDTLNKYGAIDADLTRQLAMRQLQMFEDEDQQLRKARQQLWAKPQFRAIAAPGTPDPQPLMTLMRGRVMPLTKILADMELTGIRVDRDYAEDLSIQMGTTMLNARIAINQMVPKALNEEFNPSSPQQLRAILFGTGYTNPETGEQVCYKGKEKEIGVEYTATQLESTNAKLLRSLVTQRGCALSRQILLYRAMEKAKNTFIANTLALSEEDGRLHTNFHITGTATGRLSSSDENMQNIPEKISVKVNIRGKDEDVVHNIKKVFSVTDPGNQLFVNADAKAAEVRIYAAYSKDKNLIQALNDGMDPHSYFASMIYKVSNLLAGVPPALHRETLELIGIDDTHAWSYEDFQSSKVFLGDKRKGIIGTDPWYGAQLEKLRKNIKRVVFGILYGATPNKISSIVGITEEQSQVIIATLDRMFPTIKEYVTLTKQQVQTLGVVETYFGRRRRLYVRNLPFNLRNKAERQGVNFKIQSTSSEIVLGVLCAIDEVLRHDLSGQLLLTVHDSVCFELPKKYAAQAVDLIEDYGVKRVGKMYPWLPVPFKWDVTAGPSYGEQTAIEGTPVKDVVEDPDAFIEQEIKNELADVG
jgi:DNA polymerase I-like protein with 3'-5' exonuclease and polymerase domains